MTREEVTQAVERALGEVAPEVTPAELDAEGPLREQAEIDSFDFLNFLLRLEELTGVTVPEADYDRIRTLNGLVAYLQERAH